MAKVLVGLTDSGRRCGQTHPRAKLTDAQVDRIRDWHDSGLLGYATIVKWCRREFGLVVPKSTIADIVCCRRRYALAMTFRTTVRVKAAKSK